MTTKRRTKSIASAYQAARERYAALGVDTERVLQTLDRVPVSLHCWQGDDVGGFETTDKSEGGGIMATGNYPGKARTPDELRQDIETALRLIPGRHRLNLHAFYGEFGGKKVDRDAIEVKHFKGWIDWAKERGLGLDFNPTCFAHPLAADGFTLSHPDPSIRGFWIEHCKASRKIGAAMGRALGTPAVTNIWVPDGMKDSPADRRAPRERLAASLDEIFSVKKSRKQILDCVEGKLFGIGAESFTVGMHEFYLGYAMKNNILVCLDAGHYHPTESMADKISSVLCFLPEILLHVSRGVRWDSDHVVTLNDDLRSVAEEIVRGEYLDRVHIGLDFFDASINRIAAWAIGTRNMLRALCVAMLDPIEKLKDLERLGDYTSRLALMEEAKSMPFGAVWDEFCLRQSAPVGTEWIDEVKQYERRVLSNRE